ncbi:MAG: hypothetical protein IKK29_02415 [Christensenellaceae bacterium]|nr:hypothetical protein [Christensenellaceae bacterium]
MRNFPPYPCRMNDAILLVKSYQDGELKGWLIHPQMETPKEIKNIPQLLFLLDDFLTEEGPAVCCHAFEPTGYESLEWITALRIRILFRENNTWQGCVLRDDRHKEVSFRSVLELIQIIDEILA